MTHKKSMQPSACLPAAMKKSHSHGTTLTSGRGSWDKSNQRHEPHWSEQDSPVFRLPTAPSVWEMLCEGFTMHRVGLAGPKMIPGSTPWQSPNHQYLYLTRDLLVWACVCACFFQVVSSYRYELYLLLKQAPSSSAAISVLGCQPGT